MPPPKPPGWFPRRGDVCWIILDKKRPGLILSSDALNESAADVCIVPITSRPHLRFSLRIPIPSAGAGLPVDSWAKADQVTTVPKRLVWYPPLGTITPDLMSRIEDAVRTALELHLRID